MLRSGTGVHGGDCHPLLICWNGGQRLSEVADLAAAVVGSSNAQWAAFKDHAIFGRPSEFDGGREELLAARFHAILGCHSCHKMIIQPHPCQSSIQRNPANYVLYSNSAELLDAALVSQAGPKLA